MNKYIGIEGNRLRMKTDWEKPELDNHRHYRLRAAYEAHLASLPVIENPSFKVEIDREYTEGKDIEILYPPLPERQTPIVLLISKQEASPEVSKEELRCKLSDADLLEAVQEWVRRLCMSGGEAWTLKVPVDFERDPDVLISELARRYKAVTTAAEVPKEGEDIERLREDYNILEGKYSSDIFGWLQTKKAIATELTDLRNKLYNDLPTGGVKPYDVIQMIKWHINDLDTFNYNLQKNLLTATPSPSPTIKSAEAEKLREALGWIYEKLHHGIPFYAYSDHEAACTMSDIITHVREYIAHELFPASQFRDSEPSK